MKKIFLSIFLAAGGLLTQTAKAQVGVSVGMRIGPLVINVHKPVMASPVVYDDFYYLPDVEAYYSVPEHCYYYMDDDQRWISGQYLPGRYHDYDWRSARRYEVRAQRPYANHDFYRNSFGGNRGGNWGNGDQYANRGGYDRRGGNEVYRQPQRNDDRFENRGSYERRLPSSPYDSNNAGGGRGGYNDRQMPQNRNNGGWNNDRQNDNNGWNGNRRNDNNNGWNGNRQNENEGNGGRNRNYGPDRNQGGIINQGGENRGNDGGGQYNQGNRPQGEYSRPSNNNGQGQNGNPNGGGDRGNRGGGDGQQRGGGMRQQMASVPRMGF